jgi:hypothetical protein
MSIPTYSTGLHTLSPQHSRETLSLGEQVTMGMHGDTFGIVMLVLFDLCNQQAGNTLRGIFYKIPLLLS